MRDETRRGFLQKTLALGAGALLGCAPRRLPDGAAPASSPASRANRPPVPYVDGLSFLSDRPEDIRDSGLAAFLLDVSSGDMEPGPDGKPIFRRTFESCLRSMSEARRLL